MYAPAAAGERSARVWAALIAVYLIWGSTFLAIRVALEGFPPLRELRREQLDQCGNIAAIGWSDLRHEVRSLPCDLRRKAASGCAAPGSGALEKLR